MMLRGLPALALLAVACATPAPRCYYGPVGAEFGDTIGSWSFENKREAFIVRCQGSYLNEVDGRTVRTVHLQLTATRTHGESMTLPLEGLILDDPDPASSAPALQVSEVWQGPERLSGALVVLPWSRRVVDMFFDAPSSASEPSEFLRLRFSQREADGQLQLYECQFFQLAADDPRRPGGEALHDPEYGYRDGYYFPGWGELGERRLRSADEVRLFHLFHDPEEGLLW